jgi:hypothetical protein
MRRAVPLLSIFALAVLAAPSFGQSRTQPSVTGTSVPQVSASQQQFRFGTNAQASGKTQVSAAPVRRARNAPAAVDCGSGTAPGACAPTLAMSTD